MPRPTARNDDRAGILASFCWMTAHSKPQGLPPRAKDPFHAPWRDRDPSRGAAGHGNGDFGRRAWRDHAELPDSVAEPPFVGRGALLAHRFRRNRSGLDHTVDTQQPESGSERTETSCKKRHRHMRERMSDVSKVRTPPLSGPAMFSAPPCSLIRFWLKLHSPLNLSRARRAPACGYVDNARALPTCPTGAASKNKLQFIDEGREAFGPPATSAPARPPNATKVAAPSMRGFRQPFTRFTEGRE